ncbi:MAG: hypothetical protein OXC97_07680, partial [Candidatus Dadabacteria bacterium]|nr:hypothetical protein [Candidatus Dadabacteria bacterium]
SISLATAETSSLSSYSLKGILSFDPAFLARFSAKLRSFALSISAIIPASSLRSRLPRPARIQSGVIE